MRIWIVLMLTGAGLLLAGDKTPDEDSGQTEQATEAPEKPAEIEAPPGYSAGVIGGPHDFSNVAQELGGPCAACHIPHVQVRRRTPGDETTTDKEKLSEPALELFRMQGQRQTFVTGRYTPGPTSLICLGCHDGTVASSTIGSAHAMLAGQRAGFQMPEGFVWRDHPIGVPYPRNDRGYRPATYAKAKGVMLPEGRIECVSCHDPHNRAGESKLLVMSNDRSGLCLACHVK